MSTACPKDEQGKSCAREARRTAKESARPVSVTVCGEAVARREETGLFAGT